MNLEKVKTVYFIGIGGIGMSALARYFHAQGKSVHGYDKTRTSLTQNLENEGMKVHYNDNVNLVPTKVDLTVYTPAVPQSHSELQYLRNQGVPVKKRAEVLGMISHNRPTIAIAGTHGKTTTSSIITHLLCAGGIDCSAFLGGIAQNFGSNFVSGQSDWVVAEADEFDRSFLHLRPEIAVILSMDPDHLDIYGDPTEVEKSFFEFTDCMKKDGFLLAKYGLPVVGKASATYGIEKGNYFAKRIRVVDGKFVFNFHGPGIELLDLIFTLPGHHNVENATAAIAVALQLGVSESAIRKGLASFKGIKRRFETIYRDEQCVYIDDYAHHPEELKAAIKAARTLFPKRNICGIFQPHLYSRTRDFAEGFAEALDALDEVILLDIYPAREKPIPGVTSEMILSKMKNPNRQLVNKDQVVELLKHKQIDVLLTLGAGNIDTLTNPIKNLLNKP